MIAKDATARPWAFYVIAVALPVTEVTAAAALRAGSPDERRRLAGYRESLQHHRLAGISALPRPNPESSSKKFLIVSMTTLHWILQAGWRYPRLLNEGARRPRGSIA